MADQGTRARSQTCKVTWWKKPDTPCRAAKDLVRLLEPRFITNFPLVHVSLPLLIHTHLGVHVSGLHVCARVHAWDLPGVCA